MIQFDFESIKQRVINNLSSKSEWAEFLAYGTNSLLIDAIAQEMAYQVQYKEYLTFENWWSLARNKSSLLVTAPIHGYKVPRKIGANGFVTISVGENFDVAHPRDIYIPKFFQFSNGETTVCSSSLVRFPAGDLSIDIPVKQGEYKELTFIAVGDTFETYDVVDDSVENSMYELYVNNILWNPVVNLFEHTGSEIVYELNTSPDFRKVTLRFGNNVFGKKLNTNDTVLFRYISTLGANGNISSINIIDTVESQAYDDLQNSVDLFVTNNEPILGGFDYPNIEQIRSISPKVFQSGDRASTRDDYQVSLEQLDFISKATVWGVYEYNIDRGESPWTFVPSEENVVHLAVLNSAYQNLNTIEQNETINLLYPKASPTDVIVFETVDVIDLVFKVNAVVLNSSFSLLAVKAGIDLALSEEFSIEKMQFNQNIHGSDLARFVDEVEGVRNHTTTVFIEKEFEFTSAYVSTIQVPLYPMNPTDAYIYIKKKTEAESEYTQLGYIDGNGDIRSVQDPLTLTDIYNLSGSNISLGTGSGLLVVQFGLFDDYDLYDLKIKYSLSVPDIELRSRAQILRYKSSDITISYPF
ncbi:MAG: hypothetical protein AB7V16_07440 [Vulcanibacillus sp.]